MQFPWKYTDSSYYKYLLNNPPKNVLYLNTSASKGVIIDKKKFLMAHKTKQMIKKIIRVFSLPIPNAHITKTKEEYDMIHGAHCLSLHRYKPWVTDIEDVAQFYVGGSNPLNKKIVRRILKRKNCKKIIAWTNWTKNKILREIPEIKNKIEVVYPAMPVYYDDKKRILFEKKKGGKIRLLFISRRFYFKGGLQAVEVMDRLTKMHKNVEGLVISDTPSEILEKYGKNKKIKFSPLVSQDKIFNEIYPSSDIIIYPAYTDTFGFIHMEALSFGIPLIGVEGHCNKEIIENGKTGFLVDFPKKKLRDEPFLRTLEGWDKYIEKMVKEASKLIKGKKMREEHRKNALKEIKEGKFSIKKRNDSFGRIYEKSLE